MTRQLLTLAVSLTLAAVSQRASAAVLLAVDVNDRTAVDSPNSVAGFSSYALSGTTAAISAPSAQAVGAYTVTMAPFDDGLDENTNTAGVQNTVGAIDDRDRTTPVDAGAFTHAQIYDDLIFAGGSTGFTGGLDLSVSGGSLAPNTFYAVSIYSFDSGSNIAPLPRTANWVDRNNGDLLVTATVFDGSVLPTTNSQYKFTGLARTDGAGVLQLRGRNTTPIPPASGVAPAVVINGFEIAEIPEPAAASMSLMIGAALVAVVRRKRGR
jgi:hypothetical protein